MIQVFSQLGLDSTYPIQFLIFVLTFALVSKIFFQPYGDLLEERAERTTKDKQRAEALEVLAREKVSTYEQEMAKARHEANREFERIIEAAKGQETKLIQSARDEAKQKTQDALMSVQADRSRAQAELDRDVEPLATRVSEALLR